MATTFLPEMATPLPRPNAAQWGTHIRRCNRNRSDGAVAIVRSDAAAIRVLGIFVTVVIAQPRSYRHGAANPDSC